METHGKLLFKCQVSKVVAGEVSETVSEEESNKGHYFFAPRLYEIDDISVLTKEVFEILNRTFHDTCVVI